MPKTTQSADEGKVVVHSNDGGLRFSLTRTAHGLFVERRLMRAGQARIVQSALFRSEAEFERWCDSDVLRFDDPIAHTQLKRHGEALLDHRA